MNSTNKILIVEDELTNAILLKRVISRAGFNPTVAHSGVDALKFLKSESFDAVLTDWMMPQIDGIELIRQIRENYDKPPYIIMVTALVSEGAKSYALESGADDYIAKPIDVDEVLTRLKDGLLRHNQSVPEKISTVVTKNINVNPPFPGVFLASSTGGPPALLSVFKNIDHSLKAAYFVVQHGPAWMLETFSMRLAKETKFTVNIASNNMMPEIGNIYLAPGDKHIRIDKETYRILLDSGPKENFVRPSADPMFRSAAECFGKYGIGIILTGLGSDGALGAAELSSAKGEVFIQDPETAVAPSMPKAAIKTCMNHKIVKLEDIGKRINEKVFPLAASLKVNKR
jgi:two-component system chemotaxis response regulator CheB